MYMYINTPYTKTNNQLGNQTIEEGKKLSTPTTIAKMSLAVTEADINTLDSILAVQLAAVN